MHEQVAKQELDVRFISTDEQVAVALTKPLGTSKFLDLRSKLLVLPRPEFEGG